MEDKSSVHYIVAHEKIRDLIFEDWEKTNLLLNEGPETLKQYFCKLWNEVKLELEYTDEIDIIDLDREIKPEDFNISYSILDNEMKAFNFIMPKPVTDYGQAVCLTLVLTKRMPRLFTLELGRKISEEDCYFIGEWQIDFENDSYMHLNYGTIDSDKIGGFLGKINGILDKDI